MIITYDCKRRPFTTTKTYQRPTQKIGDGKFTFILTYIQYLMKNLLLTQKFLNKVLVIF